MIKSIIIKFIKNFYLTAPLFYTLFFWKKTKRCYQKTTPITVNGKNGLPKIAFVCDEMTWQDFKNECNALFVTPSNWYEAFLNFKPDLFFCESAFRGIDAEPNSWEYRIYKNKLSFYENRKELFDVIKYCKRNNIPTIFFNKEDPILFNNKRVNFIDTALHFDYIFTTAMECIPEYKALGCKNVHQQGFGFSPSIFFPDESIKKENTAVFAGSWFSNYETRCFQMIELFDFIIAQGIELIIYNRFSDGKDPNKQFPIKYKPYIREKVKFDQLGDIFRRSRYAVNINTVTDSETMYARRVVEVMACGCIVISNESKGLRSIFGKNIWFLNEEFDHNAEENIKKENIQKVFQEFTCSQKIKEILSIVYEKKIESK